MKKLLSAFLFWILLSVTAWAGDWYYNLLVKWDAKNR